MVQPDDAEVAAGALAGAGRWQHEPQAPMSCPPQAGMLTPLSLSPVCPPACLPADEDQDEFAEHFKRVRPPNVLITTSYKVTGLMYKFISELLEVRGGCR